MGAERAEAQDADALSVDQIIEGICAYYQRIGTLKVSFTETFDKTVWEDRGKTKGDVGVQVEGEWTVKIDDQTALNGAQERLSLKFLQGANAFVSRSVPESLRSRPQSVIMSLVFTWDGTQAKRLEQRLVPNQLPQYGDSFGQVLSGGSFGGRSDFRIGTFLLYFIDLSPRETLRDRFDESRQRLRIIGSDRIAGVRALKLEDKQPQRTWRVWVAPENGYVIVRQELQERTQSNPWYVIQVDRLRRFGDLWFPTAGSIQDNMATANPELDPDLFNRFHRFTVRNLVINQPLDDKLFTIDWPPSTIVREHTTQMSYRTSQGDTATRSAALDQALAKARAARPPQATSGVSSWTIAICVMFGAIALAVTFLGVRHWVRRQALR